jgi:hypothetical protein
MQEEQRRVAKGQLTALMQAGHPWHERRRWQECRLVDPRTTNCCAMSVCEEMPPCRDIAHVSCYRPQSSEHLGRWSSAFLVRNGTWLLLASLTNGKPKFQEIFPKKCRLPSFPERAT